MLLSRRAKKRYLFIEAADPPPAGGGGSIFLENFLNNISDHDNFVSFVKRKYERMFWVPTFIPLGLRKIFYDDLKKKLRPFYV